MHTAGELAAALGFTKPAVLDYLKAAPPSGAKMVRGQKARAWQFCALPAALQTKLEAVAQAQGFRNAHALLAPQSQAAPASTPSTMSTVLHGELLDWIKDNIPDRNRLRNRDKEAKGAMPADELAWAEILRHYQNLLAALEPPPNKLALKASLLDFLLAEIPGLVRTTSHRQARALRRTFDRKLAKFTKAGRESLRDGRVRSGNFRDTLCSACWEKIHMRAASLGGKVASAWRQLKQEGKLCARCAQRHRFDMRAHKSYVPATIRACVSPFADAAQEWLKSEAAGRMAGPYIPRDHSDYAPGDYFVADDVTWNHNIHKFNADGGVAFYRPECLYFADQRTGYPVGFLLIDGHYNARHIRQALLNTHDLFGLPHKGLWFENGVWRARLVADKGPHWVDFVETEDGLKTLGGLVKIKNHRARNPRSKVIEGDFRILQERMRCLPGFVGFNEREEKSDAQKDLERRAVAGKEDPRNASMTLEDLRSHLSTILQEFAEEPQNGARNPGRSPAEGWREGINSKPLRKLPPEARWILATCRQLRPVNANGIVLTFNKHEKWTYADEGLGAFLGQQVWAHYHLDCPELLTVCDLKKTRFISVKGIRLPANSASSEQLASAHKQIAGFNRVARTIAGAARNSIAATVTNDNDFTPAQRQIGIEIEQDKAAHVADVERAGAAKRTKEKQGERMILEGLAAMREAEKGQTT
ncbi:hypothetical protein SBV1_660001 [Verrucomicrobia bacterium]|nr:hypothetical protein SBV1_660001 [Verrucomicrobiota bacterium]